MKREGRKNSTFKSKEVRIPYDTDLNDLVGFETSIIIIRKDEVAVQLWTFERDKVKGWNLSGLYRTNVLKLLEQGGFCKRYSTNQTTFLIQGGVIIEMVSDTIMRDYVKAHIESSTVPLSADYVNATYEGRLEIYNRQQHLIINAKGLEGLRTHTRPLLRDTESTCYLPFENGIVQITANETKILPYSELTEFCIWKTGIIPRHYNPDAEADNCHYAQFIRNVSKKEPDRLAAFKSAIGYLIHNYGNPAEGQAIICYDEEITDANKPEGGTGKGVFGNAIGKMRPVAVIDGKKFDPNDRFCFQQVNRDTAVVWVDDPNVNHHKPERRFTLERFFSLSTEGWQVEKKNKDAFTIPAGESPKLLISSNVILSNEGSSNLRRQFVLEFSPHYKQKIKRGNEKPIQAEHGCNFFSSDWDTAEWQRFDRYMIRCVQDYLQNGLKPYTLRNANQNRLRQTAGEDFCEWVSTYEGEGLTIGRVYERDALWLNYKAFAGLPPHETNTRGFTNKITSYAQGKGWKYERGNNQRGITFTLTQS
jgi:hypothetical protein